MAASRPMDVRAPPVVIAVRAMATCAGYGHLWPRRCRLWRITAKFREAPIPMSLSEVYLCRFVFMISPRSLASSVTYAISQRQKHPFMAENISSTTATEKET